MRLLRLKGGGGTPRQGCHCFASIATPLVPLSACEQQYAGHALLRGRSASARAAAASQVAPLLLRPAAWAAAAQVARLLPCPAACHALLLLPKLRACCHALLPGLLPPKLRASACHALLPADGQGRPAADRSEDPAGAAARVTALTRARVHGSTGLDSACSLAAPPAADACASTTMRSPDNHTASARHCFRCPVMLKPYLLFFAPSSPPPAHCPDADIAVTALLITCTT